MPTPGAAGHDEYFYAYWADRYVKAVKERGQRYMASLVELPGEDRYKAPAIRRIIKRAEQLGMLTDRGGPGKAGGRLTDKAGQLLKERATNGID